MREKFTFYLLLIFAAPSMLKAQTEIEVKDLKTPVSPAFIIMDVAPTQIQTPKSFKALAVSIYDALAKDKGIPRNFGLEFSPYWLKEKHKNLTPYKFYGITQDGKSSPFSKNRDFSISLASVSRDAIDTVSGIPLNNFSFGFRTTFISVKAPAVRSKIKSTLENQVKAIKDAYDPGSSPSSIAESIASNKNISKYTDTIQKYALLEPVFQWDIAAANNIAFDNNNVNSVREHRFSAWTTMTACINNQVSEKRVNHFYFMANLRYTRDNVSKTKNIASYNNNLDFGAKFEGEFGPFTFSFEGIGRNIWIENGGSSITYRYTGNLQYKVFDGVFVTGAIGKNFGDKNNLIATFGITTGFLNQKFNIPNGNN